MPYVILVGGRYVGITGKSAKILLVAETVRLSVQPAPLAIADVQPSVAEHSRTSQVVCKNVSTILYCYNCDTVLCVTERWFFEENRKRTRVKSSVRESMYTEEGRMLCDSSVA